MFGEMQSIDRTRIALGPKTNARAIQDRTKEIILAMKPYARCDRGGCQNHIGTPCSMDIAWDHAHTRATEELSGPEEIV